MIAFFAVIYQYRHAHGEIPWNALLSVLGSSNSVVLGTGYILKISLNVNPIQILQTKLLLLLLLCCLKY